MVYTKMSGTKRGMTLTVCQQKSAKGDSPQMIGSVGEETVNDMLQTFSCVSEGVQLNEEVEKFVRNSSVEFYKRKI